MSIVATFKSDVIYMHKTGYCNLFPVQLHMSDEHDKLNMTAAV